MTSSHRIPQQARVQQGIVLVMALVFLLLLTLIGISALGTTSLEEKMAHNAKDRNLAFQSAESALFLGESWLAGLTDLPIFPNNSMGLYSLPPAASSPVWESVNWSGSNVITYPNIPYGSLSVIAGGAGASLGEIQTQPKYLIEYLARVENESSSLAVDDPYRWRHVLRVTARGTGGTDAAQVMTQSNFSWAFK
jgi:type IV pilus assembly protein PilX